MASYNHVVAYKDHHPFGMWLPRHFFCTMHPLIAGVLGMSWVLASAALVRQMASVMNFCSALCQMANAYMLAIFQ